MSNIFIENKTANINISASGDEGIPKISLGTSSNNRIQEVAFDLVSGNNLLCDSLIDLLEGSKILVRYGNSPGTILSSSDLELLKKGIFSESLTYSADTSILSYYVNTVNGNDYTGDGSESYPFQTLTKVQQFIPRYINEKINIYVDAPPANPITVMNSDEYTTGINGQLLIEGVNDQVVESGPYTVAAVSTLGVAGTYGHTIQAGGAPGWGANTKRGYIVKLLTGTNAGHYITILSNTTDTLYSPNHSYAPAPGDTFNIVSPGTVFNLGSNHTKITLRDNTPQYTNKASFQMTNIDIAATNFDFNCDNVSMNLFMVSIDSVSFTGDKVLLNYASLKDTTVVKDTKLAVINQQCLWVDSVSFAARTQLMSRICYGTSNIITGICAQNYSGFVTVNQFSHGNLTIFRGLAGDKVGNNIDLWDEYHSKLTIRGMWVLGCTNIISAGNGTVFAKEIEGNVANVTGYGIKIGGCVHIVFKGVILGGTTNDIQWVTTGAGAAYPAAGTGITDTFGAFCTRMT